MRGIGVAVMWSTCGRARARRLGVEGGALAAPRSGVARPPRPPPASRTPPSTSINAWVPTTSPGWPEASESSSVRRAGPWVWREVSSAAGSRFARQQRLERPEVLLGQGFGRRHQRRLVARLHRPQHRVEGDDRLAAPIFPTEAAASAGTRARSPSTSSSAASWSPASSNGSESSQPATRSPGRSAPRPRPLWARRRPPGAQRSLVEQQLFEGEPVPRLGGLAASLGKCEADQRVGDSRLPSRARSPRGQRLDRVASQRAAPARPTHAAAGAAAAPRPSGPERAPSCGGPAGASPSSALGPRASNSCSATVNPRFSSLPRNSSLAPRLAACRRARPG